jgi:hypothetical protein
VAQRETIDAILDKTAPLDTVAGEIIATYAGDAKAAVADLVAIVRHLSVEIRRLSAASSTGFARRRPGR